MSHFPSGQFSCMNYLDISYDGNWELLLICVILNILLVMDY